MVATLGSLGSVAHAAVIPPGQEGRIRALLAPADLGTEIQDGISLQTIQIDKDTVEIGLYRGEALAGTLTLAPARGDPEDSESFCFSYRGDEAARPAAERLMRAVREQDDGDIYIDDIKAPPRTVSPEGAEIAEITEVAEVATVEARTALLEALAPWVAALSLLLIFAIDPPRRATSPPKPRRPRGHLVVAIVGAAAWGWYVWIASEPPPHRDTLVDYGLAMECGAGHCIPHHSSLEGFSQGFGFLGLIALFDPAGLDPTTLHSVILVAAALSVVAVGLGANHLYPDAGGVAATLAIPLVSVTAELPSLWNPSIGPLPYALVWVFLALALTDETRGLARGRPGALPLVLAALAVVASAEAHIIAWMLGGVVCMVAAWARPRGLVVAGLLAVFLGSCLAMTQPMNLETLVTRPPWSLMLAGGGVVLGLSLARRRVRLSSPVAFGLLSLIAALAITVGGLLRGVDNDPRYYSIVVPGLCMTVGVVVAYLRGASKIPALVHVAAAITAAYLFVGLLRAEHDRMDLVKTRPGAGLLVTWSMTETVEIARALVDRGHGYDTLVQGLQGPNVAEIVAVAALLVPDPAPQPARGVKLRLVVVRRTDLDALDEPLPPGWTVLDVALGWDRVALLGELHDPYLRTTDATYELGERSVSLGEQDWADLAGGRDRSRPMMVAPWIPRLVEAHETSRVDRTTLRVPIVALGDEPRIIQLAAPEWTPWRFADAGAVDIETVPSGWRVRVTPQAGTTAEIRLEAPPTQSPGVPLMELRESERVILELLDRASVRVGDF